MNIKIEKIGLGNIFPILMRRRRLVAAIGFITVVVVMIGTFASPSLYRAKARIIIEPESANVAPFPELYALQSRQKNYYQTQYKILQSRALAEQVLRKLRQKHIIKPRQHFNRMDLLRMITITPVKSSWLVDIKAQGQNPALTAAVANTWAEQFIHYTVQSKLDAVAQVLDQLRLQLSHQSSLLKQAREELQRYKEEYELSSMEERQGVEIQRLNDLNKLYTHAQKATLTKETVIKQYQEHIARGLSPDFFPTVLNNNLIKELKNQYIRLQTKYSDSSKRYQPRHPAMIQLRAEMTTMKEKIDEEIQKIVKGMDSDYLLAKAEAEKIAQQLQQQKKAKLGLDRKSINYNSLKEHVTSAKKIYEAVLGRLNETDFYQNIKLTNIRILERGTVPSRPFSPHLFINFLLSLLVGSFLGLGSALVLEHLDDTIKTPEDVKLFLDLPVIGSIPIFQNKNWPEDQLIIFRYPHTHLSEAFRSLRTTLMINAPKERFKTILVSSAAAKEGKTLFSLQLAAIMSQVGEEVLLVDCDLRKPNIYKSLQVSPTAGLNDYLSGKNTLEEVVVATQYPHLSILPTDRPIANPSELLSSPRFTEFLNTAGNRWDRIIFDSPPLISVTDGAILAAKLDGVIMIIRAYQTAWEVALQGKNILTEINANLLGVVLNEVEWTSNYYYYQTYGYYGSDKSQKA